MTPTQYLRSLGREYVTLPDIARSIALDYNAFFCRLRDLPDREKPEAHGAFTAGRTTTFTLDAGITFAEHHVDYWAKRQAARKEATS